MTNMKRTTVSLPDEMVAALAALKQTSDFKGCSDSEVIRRMVLLGLASSPAVEIQPAEPEPRKSKFF